MLADCVFQEIDSSRFSNLWAKVHNVLRLSFNYYGIYRDICFFISDINCILLIFFIVSLARGLLILLIFPKNQLFGFADFFLLIFCFQFH